MMNISMFGAPLMECKLQTTNVVDMYVTCLSIYIAHPFCYQLCSLSYHAASGNIAIGFASGHVGLLQTESFIAPQAPDAPQAPEAPQISDAPPVSTEIKPFSALQVPLPTHACVRERLAEAQAQANDIQASLKKADSGLRQQMSREQELKQSIADLEAKCACNIMWFIFAY